MYVTTKSTALPSISPRPNIVYPFSVRIPLPRIGARILSAFRGAVRLTGRALPVAGPLSRLCLSLLSSLQTVGFSKFSEADVWPDLPHRPGPSGQDMTAELGALLGKVKQLWLCLGIESLRYKDGHRHSFNLSAVISDRNLNSYDIPRRCVQELDAGPDDPYHGGGTWNHVHSPSISTSISMSPSPSLSLFLSLLCLYVWSLARVFLSEKLRYWVPNWNG